MSEGDFKAPPFTRLSMLLKHKASGALDENLFWRLPDGLS